MLANIFDWLIKNKEWLFSGIGISVIAVLFAHGKKFYNRFVVSHKPKGNIFKEYYLVFYKTVFNKLDVKNYAANSTSKCKITKCFCKSTPLVLRNSISFLVSH